MIRQHEIGLGASDEEIETDVELPRLDEAGIFYILLHSQALQFLYKEVETSLVVAGAVLELLFLDAIHFVEFCQEYFSAVTWHRRIVFSKRVIVLLLQNVTPILLDVGNELDSAAHIGLRFLLQPNAASLTV